MATADPFDYIDIHGARVIVIQTPLHPACANDDEVDFHVGVLKDQLDQLVIAMKASYSGTSEEAAVLRPWFDGRPEPRVEFLTASGWRGGSADRLWFPLLSAKRHGKNRSKSWTDVATLGEEVPHSA